RISRDREDFLGLRQFATAVDGKRALQRQLPRRRVAREKQLRSEEWREDSRVESALAHPDDRQSRRDRRQQSLVFAKRMWRNRDLRVTTTLREHRIGKLLQIGHALDTVERQPCSLGML